MSVGVTRRLTTKAARNDGLKISASLTSATISLLAHTSYGLGCPGISTKSAASNAERAKRSPGESIDHHMIDAACDLRRLEVRRFSCQANDAEHSGISTFVATR